MQCLSALFWECVGMHSREALTLIQMQQWWMNAWSEGMLTSYTKKTATKKKQRFIRTWRRQTCGWTGQLVVDICCLWNLFLPGKKFHVLLYELAWKKAYFTSFFSNLLYPCVSSLRFSSFSLSLIPLFLRLLPLSMTPCEGINSPSVNQYCFLSLFSPLPPPPSLPFSSPLIESQVLQERERCTVVSE